MDRRQRTGRGQALQHAARRSTRHLGRRHRSHRAKKMFPDGWNAPKPYLRVTLQPAETGRVVPARRQPRALRNVIRIEVRLGGKARPTDVASFSPYRIPCRTALAPGRPVMPAVPPWRRCPTTTKQCMRHAQGCTAVGHASGTVEDHSAGGISGNDGSTSASANSRVAPLVMTRRPPCRQLGVGGSLAILSKV